MSKLKAGLVGCGNISDIYLKNSAAFEAFDIVACADVDLERAKEKAAHYNIPMACTPTQLMEEPDVDFVLNLTPPSVHAEVALLSLEAGKHVYSEKPLSVTRSDAEKIVSAAEEGGLKVGNAPDTFLGGGIQTCRHIMDQGMIGDPVSAAAFMMNPGHEHWHPNPDFYYQTGGGPLFDMGPYYLTTLIFLMGPIHQVTGTAKMTYPERTITSEKRYGEKIKVTTPTQVNAILDFENGASASLITSFDTWHHRLPHMEIYGSEGSMVVPDPNRFDGPVYVRRFDEERWSEYPLTHGFTENSRGLGAADFAYAIMNNRAPRASGALAFHVLDAMQGIYDSSQAGKHYKLSSTCEKPDPLPVNLTKQNIDDLLSMKGH